MSKLIVSLTTIPSRVAFLERFLEGINTQSLQPDQIELNLPTAYTRRDLGKVDRNLIPDDFRVFECEDIGPATKVIPTIRRHEGTDTQIVYCDDDRLYDPAWLERLVGMSRKNPEACIAERTLPVKSRIAARDYKQKNLSYRLRRAASLGLWRPMSTVANDSAKIIEGFAGALVRPEFFGETVYNVPEEAVLVDDVWLSANLALNKTPILNSHADHKGGLISRPIMDRDRDIGEVFDALVNINDPTNNRTEADFRAIKYVIRNLGVWSEYSNHV